tara:strand:- start:230 stop:682 length:453 start_codon:yes stop_codon:yes gene_type:complete
MKNFILIISIIFLTSCGYSTVYKQQEKSDIQITLEATSGNNTINNLIKSKIKKYNSNSVKNNFNISVNSNFTKTVLSRDTTGKASDFKLNLIVEFTVRFEDNIKYFIFEENLNIENSSDTYEQNNYENSIKNNFVNSIIEKLILKLILLK